MRRSPISRISRKRKAEADAYDRARTAAYLRDRGECQAKTLWPDVECHGRIDPHHLRPRSRGGALADVENLRCLCRAHHDSVHAYPLRATALGLLK